MRQIHTFFLPFGGEPNFFHYGALYIPMCSNAGFFFLFVLLGDSSLHLVRFVCAFLFFFLFVFAQREKCKYSDAGRLTASD